MIQFDEDGPMAEFRLPPLDDKEVWSTQDVSERLWAMPSTEGSLDGDDPIEDNYARAGRAMKAVYAYAEQDGILEGESVRLAVSDLLSDLRHLLDFTRSIDDDGYPATLDELAESGRAHYDDEIRGVL